MRHSFALLATAYTLLSCSNTGADQKSRTQALVDNSQGSALLGFGYDAQSEKFTSKCVEGDGIFYTGAQTSELRIEKNLNFDQMRDVLDVAISGKFMVSGFNVSGGARFASTAATSDLSSTVTIVNRVRGKRAILDNPRLTKSVLDNVATWDDSIIRAQCGDTFVNGVDLGAELFVTLKFEFANKDVKSDFDANIKLDFVSLFEVEGAAKVAFERYKDTVSVKLMATQVGGKPSQLTSILGKPEGGALHIVECSLKNRLACEQSLESILRYTRDDFSQQLARLTYDPTQPDGAAFLKYNVDSYYSAGLRQLYPNPGPVLKLEVAEARNRLLKLYLVQSKDRARADAVLNMRLSEEELMRISSIRDILQSNIQGLVAAAQVCYDTPGLCLEAEKVLVIKIYNPKDLNKLSVFYDYCVRPDKTAAVAASLSAIKKSLDFPEDVDCVEVETILNNEFALDLTAFGAGALSDLRPLSGLKKLRELKIRNNLIRDLSPLTTIPGLTSLDLRGNRISNVEAIVELPKLKSLDLAYNRIIDVTPLGSLGGLQSLKLQKNLIRDFAPVLALASLKTRYLSFDDICQQQREFAIKNYPVRLDDAEYYRDTNFAPIYKVQDEPLSGLVNWANCNYVATLY